MYTYAAKRTGRLKSTRINLRNKSAHSAECSELSGLNRLNAPSHSKTLSIRELNGFSRSESLCLRIRLGRMDRIESDESS
mgnify:CR=1 FL=1